ncbi:radical SAM protein [Calderihabitans maritimus]|uniref:Radical SAM protein n=2 Tax=Calderihabitans maritimus TaxID=1246530 RepID=A0A1Z5HTQ6_9FIRM|nr:radical SAM protein [Calderihabitans maritimus]
MNSFSHIYIEKSIATHPITKKVLHRFPHATRIEVNHYKDVFCRTRQNFFLQKNSRKLILAVKKDRFIYPGTKVCQNFGNEHFYYTSSVLNCIYECDYCYLQGMYPSANIVVFVNIEDFFSELESLLQKHPVYLSISYDTDLLAFENVVPFASMWIQYARRHPDLQIELRTKSVNYSAIRHLPPSENIVLAWTLSPQEAINEFEQKTPSLNARLKCIKQSINDGWKVRLCFDPILYIEKWQEHYKQCIQETFSILPAEKIKDISIGVFRMPRDYLKNIRKNKIDSPLLHYPFECKNGIYSYPEQITRQLIDFVYQMIHSYVPSEKIYL